MKVNESAETFADVERNFTAVVKELMNDRSLDRFRDEYEKLHEALTESRQQNSALLEKCRQLNADITRNAKKVATVLHISQSDQKTIACLRKEFEKAWKVVEVSQEREAKSRDIISLLRDEIQNMTVLVTESDLSSHETSVQTAMGAIKCLKKEIAMHEASSTKIFEETKRLEAERAKLIEVIKTNKSEDSDLVRKMEEATTEENSLWDENERLMNELTATKEAIAERRSELVEAKAKLDEGGGKLDEHRRTLESLDKERAFYVDENRVLHARIAEMVEARKHEQQIVARKVEACVGLKRRLAELIEKERGFDGAVDGLEKVIKDGNAELKGMSEERHAIAGAKADTYRDLARARQDFKDRRREIGATEMKIRMDHFEIDKSGRDAVQTREMKAQEVEKTKETVRSREISEREFLAIKEYGQETRAHENKIESDGAMYDEKTNAKNQQVGDFERVTGRMEDKNHELVRVLEVKRGELDRQVSMNVNMCSERDVAARIVQKWITENMEYERENKTMAMIIKQMKTEVKHLDIELVNNHLEYSEIYYKMDRHEYQMRDLQERLVAQLDANEADSKELQLRNHAKQEADAQVHEIGRQLKQLTAANGIIDREIDKRRLEDRKSVV